MCYSPDYFTANSITSTSKVNSISPFAKGVKNRWRKKIIKSGNLSELFPSYNIENILSGSRLWQMLFVWITQWQKSDWFDMFR